MKTFNDIIVGIKKWAKAKEIKRGVYMDLRVLRYFLTVAKEQSFTKAAKQLHKMCIRDRMPASYPAFLM